MPKIKKQPPPRKALTLIQKRYLCDRLVFMYLHSDEFRSQYHDYYQPHKTPPLILTKLRRQLHSQWDTWENRLEQLEQSAVVHRIAAAFGVIGLVVVAQLLYPSDRALPFSRIDAHGFVGFASKQEVLQKFEDFDTRTVTVHTHTKSFTTSYRDLGVTLQPSETADEVSAYPLRQKLIPFSFLFIGNKEYTPVRDLNEAQLTLFVKDVIAQRDKLPVDATVTRQGTQLSVQASEDGYAYQFSELRSQMLRADLSNNAQIVFAPTVLEPALHTDTATQAVQRMQARINNPLMLSADGKLMKIDSETIASWVDIALKPQQKTVELTLNKSRIAATLKPFETTVNSAPIATITTLLNGLPAGMREGLTGRSLQFDDLVDKVASATPATSTIEGQVAILPPGNIEERTYTKDNVGLQNLLTYWTNKNRGAYSIDIRSQNGLSAAIEPHRIYPSVGIFRSYLAHSVYGGITSGSIDPDGPTSAGDSVISCIDRILVNLDESCTNALGAIIGWGARDNLLSAQGFESTTLAQGAGLTSANDTSDWMMKLLGGELTTRAQASSIIDVMSRHSIRSGIPKGIDNARVANLSGDYGRFRHDMAIIYHPNGTYVLSILAEGASSAQLADLSREINKVMNQ